MMKKVILGATMMMVMMMLMGFAAATPKEYTEETNYTKDDINWDSVTETCISEGISMDFGIPKDSCSQEFIDMINSGNFSENEIYTYFCSNFPEYPDLVVNTLGTDVVLN